MQSSQTSLPSFSRTRSNTNFLLVYIIGTIVAISLLLFITLYYFYYAYFLSLNTPTFANNITSINSPKADFFKIQPVLLDNSTFYVENTTYSSEPKSTKISNSTKDLELCAKHPNGTNQLICIPKCCPWGQVFDYGGASNTHDAPICKDSGGTEWSPTGVIFNDPSNIDDYTKDVTVFHKHLNCSGMEGYSIHENAFPENAFHEEDANIYVDRFYIFGNGTIHSESGLIYSEEFCLDGVQNLIGGQIQSTYSGNHRDHVVLGVCFPEDAIQSFESPQDNSNEGIKILIYWVVLPFASLFLVATITIYILVWEIHNIHGYTLFSYVVSLFGNYMVLFISQIGVIPPNTHVCSFIGICTHFFFLMTATWLTVVNFDVWHTFKYLKAGRHSKNVRRYMAYFALAVGTPFLIVCISGILDNYYRDHPYPDIIIPNYRISCVLSNASAAYYLYIPLVLLVCANLTFFVHTIFLLVSYKRSIRAVLKGTCTATEDQSFRLFLKLFVVMGFSWIFEVVGWGINKGLGDHATGISTAVAIMDVFNLLLAIPIFFIFVWKRSIFDQLWIGYPTLMRKPLSLLVFCGCVDSSPDEKRTSISASGITMSTLGRGGTMPKRDGGTMNSSQGRMPFGSLRELRKRSNDSQSSGEHGRKLSQESPTLEQGSGGGIMAVVFEEDPSNAINVEDIDGSIKNKNVRYTEISHNPDHIELEPCPKV